MTAYIITPEQHAQIVDVLHRVNRVDEYCDVLSPDLAAATTAAKNMLKAMQPVEPCAMAERDKLRTQNQALREALKRIVFTVPALDGAGGLIVEQHGLEGEYLGAQQVDPMWVIQEMVEVAQSALAQAEGWV